MSGDQCQEPHSQETVAVGALLRERRLAKGWTLQDLEDKAKVAYSTISKIERGIAQYARVEPVKSARALAGALGLKSEERAEFDRLLARCYQPAHPTPVDPPQSGPGPDSLKDAQSTSTPTLDLPGPIPRLFAISASDGRDLLGRSVEIDEGQACLVESPILLIHGPAGQGKSQLAARIANDASALYPNGKWKIDCEHVPDLKVVGAAIMRQLGYDDVPFHELPSRLQGKSILVILDSFEQTWPRTSDRERGEFLDVLTLCAEGQGTRFIITSQPIFQHRGLMPLELHGLGSDAAPALFHHRSGNCYQQDSGTEIATFLEEQLGGNPQAIIMVASYGLVTKMELQELRGQWNERWESITSHSLQEDIGLNTKSLLVSYELTYGLLPPIERAIYLSASYLPGGVIAASVSEIWKQERAEVREALAYLERLSLIESANDGWTWLGPSFRFAEYKRKTVRKASSDGEVVAQLQRYERQINDFYSGFVQTYAPQRGDTGYQSKVERIFRHFENLYAALDRSLRGASNIVEILAVAGVADALRWLYHNNLSGFPAKNVLSYDIIDFYRRVIDILEKHDDEATASRYHLAIGEILWLRQAYDDVISELAPVVQSGAAPLEIQIEINRILAHIAYTKESLTKAIEKFQNNIKAAREQGIDTTRIKGAIGLIECYRKTEEYDLAKRVFDDLKPELTSMPDNDRGNLLRGYAFVLFQTGDIKTEETYRDAEDAFIKIGHHPLGQAHCQRGLADIRVRQGLETNHPADREKLFAEAESMFDKALEFYDKANKNPSLGAGSVHLGRARLQAARGDHPSALKHADEALSMMVQLADPYAQASVHEFLGFLFQAINMDRAREHLQTARELYTVMDARRSAVRMNEQLALLKWPEIGG